MAEKEVFLTKDGLKKLEEELELLKTETRKEIAEKIKKARGFGDLSENAEYDEAKNEQAQIEERIARIENMLRNAIIIEEDNLAKDIVRLGSRVKVFDVEFEEEMIYTIVGSTEANPFNGYISNESPVGRALLGSKQGDTVEAQAPQGNASYQVLEIL